MNLVDHYGTSFVVFILATFEVIGVVWVYGKYYKIKNSLTQKKYVLSKDK